MSALPVLNEQKYEIELPISGKSINVRPWLVKEEKALMIAKESKKPDQIANTIVNVLTNCAFGEDVEKLPMVDVEYLLLMVKSFSSGEVTTVNIRCNNEVKGERCGHITEVDIDLHKEIKLTKPEEKQKADIKLTDDIVVHMRPPQFHSFKALLKDKTLTEMSFETMASAIDYVVMNDEIIRDFTAEETEEWFESFNKDQLKKVTTYLKSIPRLQVIHDFTCPSCGFDGKFTLENLFNFFID